MEKLNSLLAFLKIKDLVQNEDYKVLKLEKTSTRYGEAILAHLENKGRLFLPSYVEEILRAKEDYFLMLQNFLAEGKLYIFYDGTLKFKCKN